VAARPSRQFVLGAALDVFRLPNCGRAQRRRGRNGAVEGWAAYAILIVVIPLLVAAPARAQFVCSTTPTVIDCTNAGAAARGFDFLGGLAPQIVTVTNFGSVAGPVRVRTQSDATLTNIGNTGGGLGAYAYVRSFAGNATLVNSGSIGGYAYAYSDNGNATITNSGSIGGVAFAISANGDATLVNSGSIGFYALAQTNGGVATMVNSGIVSQGVQLTAPGGSANLTNSGVIVGGPNPAIQFSGGPDTLTLQPGSFVVGAIDLVGAKDAVVVNAGNQNLTFNTLAGATVTGNAPYVVAGNRIASVDPTGFAGADRNLMAFSDAVSGMLDGQTGGGAAGSALRFNGPSYGPADAQGGFVGALAYAETPNDALVFKNPTTTTADGSTVWAKGFVGRRVQQEDGPVLRNLATFYGGAIGLDRQIQPDLKLGGFVGGGAVSTSIAFNAGSTASDLGFAGLYGRKDYGGVFVDFDVIGGSSANRTTRNVNNNLLPGGLETASASFVGWFASPEAALGARYDLGSGWTLTPIGRLRYLAAGFDGYTETGSTANLTVGDRLTQAFEERAEVGFANTQVSEFGRFQIGATVGLIGQERAGGVAIDAALLGQTLSFATPGRSSIGGAFVSSHFDWKTASGLTLFASAEYSAFADSSSDATGSVGVRIGF
jgi:hypothetical protein